MFTVTLPCFLPFSLNYSGMCLASDAQFSDFLDGMGPAQFVGRQTLATTSLGECIYTSDNGCYLTSHFILQKSTNAQVAGNCQSFLSKVCCWLKYSIKYL